MNVQRKPVDSTSLNLSTVLKSLLRALERLKVIFRREENVRKRLSSWLVLQQESHRGKLNAGGANPVPGLFLQQAGEQMHILRQRQELPAVALSQDCQSQMHQETPLSSYLSMESFLVSSLWCRCITFSMMARSSAVRWDRSGGSESASRDSVEAMAAAAAYEEERGEGDPAADEEGTSDSSGSSRLVSGAAEADIGVGVTADRAEGVTPTPSRTAGSTGLSTRATADDAAGGEPAAAEAEAAATAAAPLAPPRWTTLAMAGSVGTGADSLVAGVMDVVLVTVRVRVTEGTPIRHTRPRGHLVQWRSAHGHTQRSEVRGHSLTLSLLLFLLSPFCKTVLCFPPFPLFRPFPIKESR